MAFDFKAATPDASVPDGSFIMGADSQAASDPSLYTIVALATKLLAVGTSPGSDTQVLFNDGGVLAGDAGLTFNKTTNVLTNTGGQLSLAGGTVTVSTPLVDATQTWNDGAVAFNGLKLNVTNTASAAGSLLMNLQVGGSSVTTISKTGAIAVSPQVGTTFGVTYALFGVDASRYIRTGGGTAIEISGALAILTGSGIAVQNTISLSGSAVSTAAGDVILTRDAANILALKNSTNAQEYRVYENTTGTIYKAIKGDRQLIKIAGAAFTNGAAASSGTLTNAPAAGNPTKWIPLDDNGTTRYIPAW